MPMSIADSFFSFEGRLARRHWWGLHLLLWLVSAVLNALFQAALVRADGTASLVISLSALAAVIALVWAGFAITAKRFHDRGKSGWWNLIGFVPVLGFFWLLIECGMLRGDEAGNAYGEPVQQSPSR